MFGKGLVNTGYQRDTPGCCGVLMAVQEKKHRFLSWKTHKESGVPILCPYPIPFRKQVGEALCFLPDQCPTQPVARQPRTGVFHFLLRTQLFP